MANHVFPYDPSKIAAIISTILFSVSSLAHVVQIRKTKAWYFTAFLVGGLFEVIGYACRAISASQTPNWTKPPVIVSTLVLLLGPTLLAASIYMVLGRVIRRLDGEHHSMVPTKWLTKIFVTGDIISFITQCAGAAMFVGAVSVESKARGRNIILAGLGIQNLFFGGFIFSAAVFDYRVTQSPTPASLRPDVPWRRSIVVLYIGSLLILARSIYRVAEFATGREGPLQTVEAYLYCLDAIPVLVCMVVFNVWHPSSVVSPMAEKPWINAGGQSELELRCQAEDAATHKTT